MAQLKSNNVTLKRILKYFRPYRKQLLAAYAIVILSTFLSLVLPLYAQKIADNITAVKAGQIAFAFGVILCGLLLESISTYIFSKTGQNVVRDIRSVAWDKVLSLKVKDHEMTQSGELSSRIINDSTILINFISAEIPGLISGMITIIGSIGIMLTLDKTMTGIFFCLAPIIIFTIVPISNKIYEISEQQQSLFAKVNGYFAEIISQIRMIKAYSGENFERQRGGNKIRELYDYGIKSARIQAVLSPLMGAVILTLLLVVGGVGLYRVSMGVISTGVLVAFALYFIEVMQPVQTVGSFLIELQAVNGTTKQLVALLDAETEDISEIGSVTEAGDIVFENINFGYHAEEPVLKNISFRIRKGGKTAIVGESGSGKTTIFSLLERFYMPDSGRIFAGDCSIQEISIPTWRRQFGYVSQDNSIISGSIKENLLYGVIRDVKEVELIQVSKMADIYGFIESLPEKFDTEVGERGEFLSGGQKQRIAIARAFLQDAPYLLLDEATANLDSESEKQVQAAIERLLKGRTAMIIAHRLSTIMDADQIIVLQNGRISGVGTHRYLCRNNPFYRKLVQQQFPDNYSEIWKGDGWDEALPGL